jgi:hypothetical protein
MAKNRLPKYNFGKSYLILDTVPLKTIHTVAIYFICCFIFIYKRNGMTLYLKSLNNLKDPTNSVFVKAEM